MDAEYNDTADAVGKALIPKRLSRATQRDILLERKKHYAEQIVLIDKGLELLDRNPDIEQLLEILGRV